MSETNSPKLLAHPTANWRPGQVVLGNPIFEIAVYRKSPRELEVEYDASLTKYLQSLEPQYPAIDIDSPKYQGLRFIRNQFWEKYGQPYPYNQVIGWVVLFAKRDQILGEYYKIAEKRLTRNCRRRRVKGQGKCFAIPLAGNETSKKIIAEIAEELRLISAESPFKGRFVDATAFMQLAPYINWKKLIREVRD
jgi:hypothetical protein